MIARVKKEWRKSKEFIQFAGMRIVNHLFLFVIPLILAKVLAPEKFGAYSLSIMVVYFFTQILIATSQSPFIVYANQESKKTQNIHKAFTARLLFFGSAIVLFFVITGTFKEPILTFASISNAQYIYFFLAFLGISFRYVMESVFLALNKRMLNAVYVLFTGIISMGYIVGLYFYSTLTLETIFLMFIIASVGATLVLIPWTPFKKLFPLQYDKKVMHEMLHHAKWIIIGSSAFYLINWGDNIVLRKFVSLEQIGVYNLSYQLFKGVLMTVYLVHLFFLPYISQNITNKKKLREYFYKKRPKIVGVFLAGIVALYFIVPLVIDILYGSTYQGSIWAFRVLLFGSAFAAYRVFYNPIYHALKRYRFTQIADIFYVVFNLGLDYILVQKYGINGAAIATMCTYIFMTITFEVYFRKYIKGKYL